MQTDSEIEDFNRRQVFVRDACPSNWLELGGELRDAAEEVWKARSQGLRLEALLDSERSVLGSQTKVAQSRPYLLLAGFATENVLKGLIVARDSEPSATIVWRALYALGIEDRTILWNALQMHPHEPGNEQSNRTPKSSEIKIGEPALQMLVREFPSAKVVAVGKNAERLLKSMGVVLAATVRHPANGGAPAFKQGLERLVSG